MVDKRLEVSDKSVVRGSHSHDGVHEVVTEASCAAGECRCVSGMV